MSLELLPVKEDSPLLADVMALYRRAFPPNERRPLEPLLKDETGASEVLAVYEGERFVGLAILLTWRDVTHILYFAGVEELRGLGYGSGILRALCDAHPGQRVIADLEAPCEQAANGRQRERRLAFYARNGFEPTEIRYTWRGEEYLIVSKGGPVRESEFDEFWDYFYHKRTGFQY